MCVETLHYAIEVEKLYLVIAYRGEGRKWEGDSSE